MELGMTERNKKIREDRNEEKRIRNAEVTGARGGDRKDSADLSRQQNTRTSAHKQLWHGQASYQFCIFYIFPPGKQEIYNAVYTI